jgi:hypothetical protein
MRKTIPVIFVIAILVVLVLCSACVFSPPGDQKPQQEGGLSQVTVRVETSRISFEAAHQKLKDYRTDSLSGSENVTRIYYILAKDVDASGNAVSWAFGVNYGMGDRLLIYDKSGWTTFPKSNTTLPSEEIAVDHIMSPGNLFTRNKAVILSSPTSAIPELRDLELQQGIYKLTLYSGSKGRILTFNATTGAFIA